MAPPTLLETAAHWAAFHAVWENAPDDLDARELVLLQLRVADEVVQLLEHVRQRGARHPTERKEYSQLYWDRLAYRPTFQVLARLNREGIHRWSALAAWMRVSPEVAEATLRRSLLEARRLLPLNNYLTSLSCTDLLDRLNFPV